MTLPLAGQARIQAAHLRHHWFAGLPVSRWRLAVAASALVLAASFLVWHPREQAPDGTQIAARLQRNAGPDGRVLTDHPMDAYRAGRLVPPQVVTLSRKRLTGGSLTGGSLSDAVLADLIRARKPLQILFRRFPLAPALVGPLGSD